MLRRLIIIAGLLLTPMLWLQAGFGSSGGFHLQRKFLTPDQAFKVQAKIRGDKIKTTVKLGEKIHIYAKDLHFKIIKPKSFELDVKKPEPVDYEGQKVYYGTLNIDIPLQKLREKGIEGPFTLEIDLSGCSDAGICYAPQKYTFDLKAEPSNEESSNRATEQPSNRATEENKSSTLNAQRSTLSSQRPTTNDQTHPKSKIQNPKSSAKAEHPGFFAKISTLAKEGNSAKIARALADEGVLFVLLLFFIAGLLLALTPCILPMIPILSSILVKQAGKEGGVSRSTAFIISLVYVVSMAATYALIGIVAGLLGFDIQAHLNNPWVMIPMAGLFVALAFSLFGYFELGLPASWQSKLTKASDEAQGKGLLGTAIMGALSALIVGTCTAPVISGAVIFISMTGDAVLGGLSLFVMGIGAGMPLLLMGLGADKLIPKPGGWMNRVSQIFGVVMLAMALYVLRGVLSPGLFMFLASLLLLGSALYLRVFDSGDHYKGAAKLIQLLALVLFLYGSTLFVGTLAGAQSLLNPLEPFTAKTVAASAESDSPLVPMARRRGYTLERLQREIAQATKEGKPVIVDIGKENCAACSELEHITFPDPKVREALKRFKFLQIDITDNTPKEQEILKHYKLFGAPNILVFDSKGRPLPDKFMVGFVPPRNFVMRLKEIH
ncbi:protein-disulfide reductase DsbD [Nitratifractor salsuginis]|uniref:Protein-disulfide reductase n=1 Tax=Nitratifractor salsuginis (strain DSM 16511 / JCM 12458 / E9I37-1) TaxID=749222 RepID=E6X2S3_NITSE|nr:protein-disulfide reductase DsbD [Nitratifractor salsuginis]ADV46139.1 Protein-disulfide reductase [Nitratifractor salsuginis DSM 16511]